MRPTTARSDHLRGLALTTAGVLVLTPDTLLLRLLDADPWTVAFWRGLLMAAGLATGFLLFGGGAVGRAVRSIGLAGLLVAAFWGCNSVLFVVAISYTKVANALIIIAAAPLFAAILSHLVLGEPVAARTWAAIVAAVFGVAMVVSDGLGHGTVLGDAAALGTAGSAAVVFTILRRARAVNMIPATALGGLAAALGVAAFASPFAIGAADALVLALMGLVMLPLSFGLITLGPRYLPAPEVGLLMLLETVLGPLLVWLALGETVSLVTLCGGAVVVAAIGLHAMAQLRRGR